MGLTRTMLMLAPLALTLVACGGAATTPVPDAAQPLTDASAFVPPAAVGNGGSGPCPAVRPAAGQACERPDGFTFLQCEYGTAADFQCDTLADCIASAAGGDDRWELHPPTAGCVGLPSTPDASSPAGCPMPRPHLGDACNVAQTCWYPATPWPLQCIEGVWVQDPPQ